VVFRQRLNKRRFPRAKYLCKLLVLRDDSKRIFTTHTQNIGIAGICLFLPEALPKFCTVEIVLYIEDGKPPLGCDGRVVWVLKRRLKFETGIEFINIKEPDCIRIEGIVQECLRK
jgi:hypothetical protein